MWAIFAFSAALTAAIVVVLSKAGMKDLDSTLVFAVQAVLILVISWGVVFFQGTYHKMGEINSRTWIYLVIAGVLTTVSSLFSFRALKLRDASVVSPIERVSLVFAIILAAVFLKEKINLQTIIGGLLMVAGAVVIAMVKKT